MSDTPRTDVAEHNMGSIAEPHYVVDVDVAHDLERELDEAKEQLRLCNIDQFTTATELAEANARLENPVVTPTKPPVDISRYKFEQVSCSQCGGEFGPGDEGFSRCGNHKHLPRLG